MRVGVKCVSEFRGADLKETKLLDIWELSCCWGWGVCCVWKAEYRSIL